MNKKIFRSSFFTTVIVVAATIVFILGILFGLFEQQLGIELEREANYLSQAVMNEGVEFFDNFKTNDNRVTLINSDGTVLFDTEADAEQLDNHAERAEIKEAREEGIGKSVRYSRTLTEKTIYYAVKLPDDSILRVSTNQYTVVTILLSLIQPLLLVLLIVLIVTLVISSRISKSIIKPINEIDLEHPEKNETYDELTPLLSKIAAQKETINKQLSEAMQKQKEFALITNYMSEGLLVIDNQANLLSYNSAALKLLGIEEQNTSQSVISICRTKSFREVVNKVVSGEKAEGIMSKDERRYELMANPVIDNDKVLGAVIIIVDVTEREEREVLRREFTANVSHELKTPLTSISGFAELMKNGDVQGETAVDFSKTIYDEAQRLISLVNDIIKISELDEKSISLESERVDIYKLSAEILERLKSEAEKKNISLNLIGESVKITGVYKILDEMIYNLCDNAIKYNKDNGSVDVIINTTPQKVNVTVRDTGIGIPAAHQQRVFERFYRVDKSHSRKIGGTGLGLAIVKHGAIYHDAEIKLESTEGKGTSVTISFGR